MADPINNANSDDSAKTASSGSPWDDDIDLPAGKSQDSNKQPKIIGSLDPTEKSDEKPVPFNIPEEVIEDKVAKKIPAEQIMGKTKPQYYTTKPASSVAEKSPSPPVAKPVTPSSAPSVVSPKSSLPIQPSTDKSNNESDKQTAQFKVSESAESTANKPSPAASPESAKLSAEKTPSSSPTSPSDVSGGVSELLKNVTPQVPLDEPLTAIPEKKPVPTVVAEKGQPLDLDPKQMPTDLLRRQTKEENAPSPLQPSNKKAMDIQKPAAASTVPDSTIQRKPAETAAQTPPPVTIKEPAPQEPSAKPSPKASKQESKRSMFSKLNPFSAKKTVQPANQVASTSNSKANSSSLKPAITPPTPAARPGMPKGPGKLSWVFAVVVIFSAIIYLTEIGLISIGLEKVYGIVGLEKIWGGLPRNVEPAMAEMVLSQKENLVFKFKGKITATVDKSKKSPVTSPLVVYGYRPFAFTDQSLAPRDKALLAQYDYYGSETGEDVPYDETGDTAASDGLSAQDYGDSSVDYDSSSADSYDSTETDFDTPTMNDIYGTEDQSSVGGYSTDEMTIKQLDFNIEGSSNDDAASSTIDLKPIVGSTKRIEIASSSGSLYVKSNDVKFDDKAAAGKWLGYKFPGLQSKNPFGDLFGLKLDSGLSAKGQRVGNDKLSSGRAYHYKIYSLELGDALGPLGISSSSVETISGDIWIGVSDHLLKKIMLEITPSVSSSISKLTCEIDFYDYGTANSIVLPAFDNVVTINEPTIVTTEEDRIEEEPIVAPPVDPGARVANDTKRHNDLEAIKTALNSYKQSYGRYPVATRFVNLSQAGNVVSSAIVPKYLSSLPTDPNAASGWWYGYKSDGKTFTLSARFENINDAEVTNVDGIYLHYVKN